MEKDDGIKTDEIKTFYEAFSKTAEKELNVFIDEHFRELVRIVKAFKTRHEKLTLAVKNNPRGIKELRDFNTSLLDMLSKYQQNIADNQQKHFFEQYSKSLSTASTGLPAVITRRELFTPYQLSFVGKPGVFWRKLLRNLRYYLQKNSIAFFNRFRKLFKKKVKETNIFQTRKVPFRNMVAYHLESGVLPGMAEVAEKFMKIKSTIIYRLWKFNEKVDDGLQNHVSGDDTTDLAVLFNDEEFKQLFDEVEAQLGLAKTEFRAQIAEVVDHAFERFDQAAHIVDTPDLSVKTYLKNGLNQYREEANSMFADIITKWANTQVTLFDDWIVDVEVVQLYYAVLSDFELLKADVDKFVNVQLVENLNELIEFIGASASRLEEAAVSVKQVKEALNKERQTINRDFVDKMLTKSIEKISGSYAEDIEKFRQNTIHLADKVSTKRGFVKGAKYDRGIKTGEINYLSPRELLNFEAIPHFEKAVGNVSSQVDASVEKAKLKMLSSGTVCDFSLESALMLLEQKKKSYKAAQQVATEGYNRSIANIGEARELIIKISKEPLANLNEAIHDFNAEIQKLKNTENILELNIRIARIRAVERSKKARRDAVEMVKSLIPTVITFIKEKLLQTSGAMEGLKNWVGMSKQQNRISYEVTEFISQAQASLKKLPFVYQRLYQIQPTDEERFFVNRKEEINMLNDAFDDWSVERFVTSAVIGEKGSGITSLISYFISGLHTAIPVIHHTIEQKIYHPDQYFKLFAQILEQEQFKTNEEIIGFLNKKREKAIIILENLQHAFLKRVNGFDCQRLFFDLMANTAKNVFWLGSYTTHSWEYLDRVISISDNFVREIRLKPMDSQSLMEIIYKRNSMSGYKLRFEPNAEDMEARWYKKADALERNKILRAHFFEALTTMSNGNVSLSQLYWLHSTRDVTEDTISIGGSFDIDLSFIKSIKNDYLFALHAMLIHDGLTLQAYAEVFNQPESQSRNMLIPMLEKGLLIRPREKYNINPIVFRQVVNLLRSRNFIS